MKDNKTLEAVLHIASLLNDETIKARLLSEIRLCQRLLEMQRVYEDTYVDVR